MNFFIIAHYHAHIYLLWFLPSRLVEDTMFHFLLAYSSLIENCLQMTLFLKDSVYSLFFFLAKTTYSEKLDFITLINLCCCCVHFHNDAFQEAEPTWSIVAHTWHRWVDDLRLYVLFNSFMSYQDDGDLIMKGCVQWNHEYGWKDYRLELAPKFVYWICVAVL